MFYSTEKSRPTEKFSGLAWHTADQSRPVCYWIISILVIFRWIYYLQFLIMPYALAVSLALLNSYGLFKPIHIYLRFSKKTAILLSAGIKLNSVIWQIKSSLFRYRSFQLNCTTCNSARNWELISIYFNPRRRYCDRQWCNYMIWNWKIGKCFSRELSLMMV